MPMFRDSIPMIDRAADRTSAGVLGNPDIDRSGGQFGEYLANTPSGVRRA
jgi:hypothetical protein